VYNRHGRRDNIHKARIKVLVKSLGVERFREQVEAEWQAAREFAPKLEAAEVDRVRAHFDPPAYETLQNIDAAAGREPEFQAWYRYNTREHKVPGYRAVFVNLKRHGENPGDMTSEQMDAVADLADRVSFGMIRVCHNQNLLLGDVRQDDLFPVWQVLRALGLAMPNIGTLTDLIACPGLDFCSLANAGTLTVAKQIQQRFSDLDYLYDLGDIEIKMSGCMNACGHHHVGHIGILGVDKNGAEWYQVSIGGRQGQAAALGDVIGPSFAAAEMPDVVGKLIDTYVALRHEDERFVDTVHRVGIAPFKQRVYGDKELAHAA